MAVNELHTYIDKLSDALTSVMDIVSSIDDGAENCTYCEAPYDHTSSDSLSFCPDQDCAGNKAFQLLTEVREAMMTVRYGDAIHTVNNQHFRVGDWVIYDCYPHVYEGTAMVVPIGVVAIGPTRDGLDSGISPVCLWGDLEDIHHVREFAGMWYEETFERCVPTGYTVNRPDNRYEPEAYAPKDTYRGTYQKCEMYGCDRSITGSSAHEDLCDGPIHDGPYAPDLGRDLRICYICEDDLSGPVHESDAHQWMLNSQSQILAR
jgi:hypothetical protein